MYLSLFIICFSINFRHDDLKQMLDSNKDHLKLEAMKRIIGMVAKVIYSLNDENV